MNRVCDAAGAALISEHGGRRAGQADLLVGTAHQQCTRIAGEVSAIERRFDQAASNLP